MLVLLSALKKMNSGIAAVVGVISISIVGIMVAALTASAVTRYASGTGYDWLIELPPALVPWLVFPLLGPLFRAGDHIQVDLLPTFLSGKKLICLNLFTSTVTLLGSIIFLLAGYEATELFRMLGQIMELEIEIPIWWMYAAFPVGFAILALFALESMLTALNALFFPQTATQGLKA
jgi:TRAP-type C4-dicarboxylate transport system permease small subunit